MVPQGEASFPTWAALFHVVMYHAGVSTNHSIQLFGALQFKMNKASTLITTVSLTNYYILWSLLLNIKESHSHCIEFIGLPACPVLLRHTHMHIPTKHADITNILLTANRTNHVNSIPSNLLESSS